MHACISSTAAETTANPSPGLRDTDLRLVDHAGTDITESGEGRLELRVGGAWGKVNLRAWGQEEARVACTALGRPGDGAQHGGYAKGRALQITQYNNTFWINHV